MSQDDWMRFIGKLFIESGLTLDQLDHLNLSHPRGVKPQIRETGAALRNEDRHLPLSACCRPVSRRRRDPCLEASRIRPRARRARAPRRFGAVCADASRARGGRQGRVGFRVGHASPRCGLLRCSCLLCSSHEQSR